MPASMRRLRQFMQLRSADRWLLVRVALLLAIIRTGLWLLPFTTFDRLLTRLGRVTSETGATDPAAIERLTRAVLVASRYVPRAHTCLTQALATQVLLGWRGIPSSLRIGVAKSEQQQLEAHAWVECQGRVVLGRVPDQSRYALLTAQEDRV